MNGDETVGGSGRTRRHDAGRNPVDLAVRHRELIKFSLVGATTWIIDSVLFLALKSTVLADKPVTAKIVAVLVATMVSYVLNREWSFRTRGGRERRHEAALFFLVSAAAIGFYSAPLWVSRYVLRLETPTVDLLTQNVADFVSAQVVGVLLGMAFRWWALRRFVFPVDLRQAGAGVPALAPAVGIGAVGIGAVGIGAVGIGGAPSPVRPAVSVLIPTRNESDTIGACVERVTLALTGIEGGFEVLVVDDSDDTTPAVLAGIAPAHPSLRVLHRSETERTGGLSGALTLGFAQARGEVVVVMDGDLQHPPEAVPALVGRLVAEDADVCVASRYLPGGSAEGLDGRWRRWVSLAARTVVHVLIPATRGISDPCGGFFAVRATILADAQLQAEGFKILVEILARTSWTYCAEVPYRFVQRGGGTSNFGPQPAFRSYWWFLVHIRPEGAVQTGLPGATTECS